MIGGLSDAGFYSDQKRKRESTCEEPSFGWLAADMDVRER